MSNKQLTFGHDTFWNRKRVEFGFSQKQLSDYLGVSNASVGHYMVGRYIPSDEIISLLCKLFNIDFDLGKKEFQESFDKFHTNSSKSEVVTAEPEVTDTEDVFKFAYDVLDYPEFMDYYQKIANKDLTALKYVYNKVDVDTYIKIYKILSEWCK